MSKEPMNLVFEQLKLMRKDIASLKDDVRSLTGGQDEIGVDIKEVRLVQAGHTLSLDFLTERVEKLREGTLTAIGFAAETGSRSRTVEKQVADLVKRVEKLEKTQ